MSNKNFDWLNKPNDRTVELRESIDEEADISKLHSDSENINTLESSVEKDELALDYLIQATKLPPEILTVKQYLQLADDWLAKGKINLAVNCYESAFKIQPDSRIICFRLIKALEQDNQWDKACIYYQRIIELKEKDLQLNYENFPKLRRIQNLSSSPATKLPVYLSS